MDNLSTCGIVYTYFNRLENSQGTAQPLTNGPGANTLSTTAPGLDGPFANATFWIKQWRFLRQSLTQHDSFCWENPLAKSISVQNNLSPKRPPLETIPLDTVLPILNAFGHSV